MQKQSLLLLSALAGSLGVLQGQTATSQNTSREKLQVVQTKTDSLRNLLSKSTGIDLGLNSSNGVSLPGGKKMDDVSRFLSETVPDLGLRVKEYKSLRAEKKRRKEKDRLAKVEYEGIPMTSMSIKYGSGESATYDEFHVLKEFRPISQYVKSTNTRWYDVKSRKLSQSVIQNKSNALPLHGPYRRIKAGRIIEEGFYYLGVKDGRWVTYGAVPRVRAQSPGTFELKDKSIWLRGFPAESRITYYDSAHTRVKEVIPVEFGIIQGDYLAFYDAGQLMAEGKYERNERVGTWVEYYQFRRAKKKEIQYPDDCWEPDFDPYVLREWDDKGKVTFQYEEGGEVRRN